LLTQAECDRADVAAKVVNDLVGHKVLIRDDQKFDLAIVANSDRFFMFDSQPAYRVSANQVDTFIETSLVVNDKFAAYNNDNIVVYVSANSLNDRQESVMFMHEFLHSLGFGHVNNAISGMNPKQSIDDLGFTEYDYQSVHNAYNGLDYTP